MVLKTKAIILKRTKYGDKNFICQAYTQELGRLSFFVKGIKSKSKRLMPSMLESASILEVILDIQENKSLYKLIDAQWDFLYTHDTAQVQKNCVLLFIIDMLNHAIHLPEKNEPLFDYTIQVIKFIDGQSLENILNVPLFFVYHLLQVLGHDFSTEITEQIIAHQPLFKSIDINSIVQSINLLKQIDVIQDISFIHIHSIERRNCLDILLWHFVYSIQNFSIPISLHIIKKILYA